MTHSPITSDQRSSFAAAFGLGGHLPVESGFHSVSDAARQNVRPLSDCVIADPDCGGCGSHGTAEQFNCFLLVHDALNHSPSSVATIGQDFFSTMLPCGAKLRRMTYASRLEQALAGANVSIADFARAMGLTYQAVSKVLKGTTKSLTAANNDKAAKLLGVDPGWLATGEGKASTSGDQKDPVAHSVSDLRPIVNLQKVTWEALPVSDLSGRFEIDLRDDALAPEYPAGTAIRFDARRTPRPGWPVLVKDSAGAYYVRDYIEGAAGQWSATPRQRGYASLDSVAHGLQLVGVMYGADWP